MSLRDRLLRILTGMAAAGLLAAAASIALLQLLHNQPVSLPRPGGPYLVGRAEFDWVDPAREETFAPTSGSQRELLVWIWYPAEPRPGDRPAAYLPATWAQARRLDWGITAILEQNPTSIRSHAVENAQLSTAQAAYPVLILEPGRGTQAPDYTTLAQELASYGYIVAGITPTYSASVVAFPDGRLAYSAPDGTFPETGLSPEEFKRLGDQLVEVWARDVIFVMDQLEQMNAASQDPWRGRLDLDRLGVFGHSFGGAAAAQACRMDARCLAGISLDDAPFGDEIQSGLSQPFMLIYSQEVGLPGALGRQSTAGAQARYDPLSHGGYQLVIRGARHLNFTDFAVQFSPVLKLRGDLGPINGRRGLKITADYVRAFFDKYLREIDSPLLAGPDSGYPEVIFESR